MKTKLSKKRAISTVLTTVIILVSSVVLGSGVVLYGTSLFQGGTQTEAITINQISVWVDAADSYGLGIGWGALSVRNTGDTTVSVDRIIVRGADIPHTQWYSDTDVTTAIFQQALNHTGWENPGTNVRMISNCATDTTYLSIDPDGDGVGDCITADAGSGPVSMNPGQSAVIYFKLNNNTITSLDSGVSTTVSIFAGKAGGPQSVTVIGKE